MKNLLFFFFLLPVFAGAQNLVPNPSFEDTVACPVLLGQVFNALGWISSWNTPDYYNSCSGSGIVGVPHNQLGDQVAASGLAYAGLGTMMTGGNLNAREIIGRQLSMPLIPNTKYYASIKVSLADSAIFASNRIGINFSTIPYFDDSVSTTLINNHAFVYSSFIIYDYQNWVIVSGAFIADSAYNYIMIGNFFNDANTLYDSSIAFPNSFFNLAYYYIDDVCVSSDSLECDLNPDSIFPINDSQPSVYPNPANNKIFFIYTSFATISGVFFNITGQPVKFFKGKEIDISDLPNGIYILKINYNNKIIYKKQIIQH